MLSEINITDKLVNRHNPFHNGTIPSVKFNGNKLSELIEYDKYMIEGFTVFHDGYANKLKICENIDNSRFSELFPDHKKELINDYHRFLKNVKP